MPSTVIDRLQGLTTSVAVKPPCRLATTGPIAACGLEPVDGVAPAEGDRVLRKNEANAVLNGIWVAGSGAWTRALDFNGSRDAVGGTQVAVIEGSVNINSYWRVAGEGRVRIGTDAIHWEQVLGEGGIGLGLVPFTCNPDDTANSLVHMGLPLGTRVRTAFCRPEHAVEPGVTGAGGGTWVNRAYDAEVDGAIAGDPEVGEAAVYLGDPARDTPNTVVPPGRILWYGAHHVWELIPDSAGIHMAQLGLVADGTGASLGQEAPFAVARDYVLDQHRRQTPGASTGASQNGLTGLPAFGDGELHTDVGQIDLKMLPWTAGQRFKFYAPSGIADSEGNALPWPIVRSGLGTSPQNRFTLANTIDIYAEGNQNSTLGNTTTRVIGFELYNDTGSGTPVMARTNRCHIGTRIFGNTEKKRIHISGAYNRILCDYAMQVVEILDYQPVGLSGDALAEAQQDLLWHILIDDADGRGFLGEWNPVLNQQGVQSGGLAAGTVLKGGYFKVKETGNSAVAIDGRSAFTSGKFIVFDGAGWHQLGGNSNSPDSNIVYLIGQNNEVVWRGTYNLDGSGIIDIAHEARLDTGRSYAPFRDLNEPEFEVPMPAVLDRGGKSVFFRGWQRAGDQRLYGFTGKDKGTDTTGYDFVCNHLYGVHWHIEDATRVFGRLYAGDTGNARCPALGLSDVPCEVFRLNRVVDAGGLALHVSKSLNKGDDAFDLPVAGVIIGDHIRGKYSTELVLPCVSVMMGNTQPAIPDPLRADYTAIQVRKVDGLTMRSPRLIGALDYRAGAQRVLHTIPAAWAWEGDPLLCDVEADVTLALDGSITFGDLIGRDWGNVRRVIADSVSDEDGVRAEVVEGVVRLHKKALMSQVAIDCINSRPNRWLRAIGLDATRSSDARPIWKSGSDPDDQWRDASGTTVNTEDPENAAVYAPRLLQRTRETIDRYEALGLSTPPDAWIDALDTFFFELVECGAIPLDSGSGHGCFDAAWVAGTPDRVGAKLNLFGADETDLLLTEVNTSNLAWAAYRGWTSSGDNYNADDSFASIKANAGYLTTGYDPASSSLGMSINDMHAMAFTLTSHRANAGDIGSLNDQLYVRGRDTLAAAVQMGVTNFERLETETIEAGYPPRLILGQSNAAGTQKIYANGRLMNTGVRTTPVMPDGITLLQSAGSSGADKRHSPRQNFFFSVGSAIDEAIIPSVALAVVNFEKACRRLA